MAEKMPESNSGYGRRTTPEAPALGRFLKLLQNRLLLTFVFLALVVFTANLVFIIDYDTRDSMQARVDHSAGDRQAPTTFAKKSPPEDNVRIFIGMAVIAICLGCMIYLLVRKVIEPLARLCEATDQISKGNLSATAPSGSNDEIGKLGSLVNDLPSNFQEVLLSMAALVGISKSDVDKLEKSLASAPMNSSAEVNEQIKFLKSDLEKIESMAKEFEFYHARLDGGKVFSNTEE